MAERRNSLQPEPAVPRNNKRRRTMMDSVSDVARWLLPSWASEGTAESSQDRHIQAASGHLSAAGTGLSNGERNPKRARPNEVSRREPMGRLSPVASVAPSTTSAQIEPDLDDGSDSSTSGCSSLSITTPANAEACSTADAKSNQRRNRPIQNTKESKTRDVSISVDQTSIVAETSVTASPSLNFSLFSRPSRALSSTMNASLPLAGSHGSGTRSLSSSLHKPERSLNRSIFYEGKTTYGGAAAHRKLNLFSPSPYQMAARRGKPTSNVNVPESSSAAKRLIEALERMNTPVQNAKKIPLGRPESIPTLNSEARRKEALESIASLRQSSAPPPLSSCRNSVQPARIGSNVKPVLSSSSGYPIDVDESDAVLPSNASNVPVITPTPRTTSALLDNFESDRANTAGGKMKSAKTIQQHMSRKIPVEEEPPPTAPDLPSAPLPIKDLPSFSFATKPPSIAVSSTQDCHKTSAIRSPLTSLADFSNKPFEKQQMPSSLVCPASDPSEAFTFAAPVDLDKPTKTLHCKEEFDFKDPLYLKKDQHNRSGGFAVAGPTMISGNTFTLKTKTVPESTKIAVPEVLSTGSVMDIIGKNDTRKDGPEANTSASDTSKTSVWECPKCLVRNPSGVCQACESKKASTSATSIVTSAPPSLTTSVANSWGDQFKRPTSSWDCSSCLVNNKSEESSCVACGAAKPGADNSKSAAKPFGTTVANQWGDLFKKPAGQWSCKSCMLDNKPEATKCAACETPNPSAKAPSASASPSPAPVSTVKSPLSAMIKMAPGWSCDTCLVRNDLDKTKCVACETPKPGSVAAQDSTNAPKAISSAFKFGVPTSDENKNITSEPVTLVFGMKSTDKGASDGSSVPNGVFKFGLTPAKPTEEKNTTEQTNSTTKTSATPEFSFGTPANSVATSLTPQTSAAPAIGTPAKTPAASSSGTTALSTGGTSANFSGFGTSWASGTANKTDAPSSGLFTFGASSTPSTSAPAVSAVTTQKTFAFGATSTTPAAQPSAATFNFGATTAASSAAPTTTAPAATFTFAGFATPAKPPAAGGLFGPAPATSAFGANTTVTTATTSQPTASASFSFTSPASTGTTATPTVTATTSVSATPSPMFTFGNPSATANSSETQNSGAAFVFGSSSSTAGRLSGFGFGPAATTAASAASTFSFGASAAPAATTIPTVSNGPSVFGSGSLQSSTPFGVTSTNPAAAAAAPAPATNSVFQFNSNPTAAAPGSTTPFTFTAGVSSTAAAPSSGGLFAFGASNTNTAAPPPATNSATVPGAATPFQFGASSSTVTATPAAAPAPNDMFNFAGAPAAPAAGTFQFGAQPPGQNPAPFQFGASAPTLAPTLGFPTPNAENPFNATITQGRRMRRAVRRRGAR